MQDFVHPHYRKSKRAKIRVQSGTEETSLKNEGTPLKKTPTLSGLPFSFPDEVCYNMKRDSIISGIGDHLIFKEGNVPAFPRCMLYSLVAEYLP